MYIDKFKQPDGWYKDEEGCEYETAESWYQTKVFGFCGCGRPEDSIRIILKGLELIKNNDYTKYDTLGEAQYFLWYWLDKMGFTEHGGSVPGWLTDKGIEVYEDLKEIVKGYENESNILN